MNGDVSFFAYGTLLVPEILRGVTGRTFPGIPAVLTGYARYRIRGRSFPGIVRETAARTEGTLYRGMDLAALTLLDRFEDEFYRRVRVSVVVAGGGTREAETYVVPEDRRQVISDLPWDQDDFEREELEAFLRTIDSRLGR